MINYNDFDLMIFAKTIFAQGIGKSLQTKEAIAMAIINNFNSNFCNEKIEQKKYLNLGDFCRKYSLYKFWNDKDFAKKLNDIDMTNHEFALAVRIGKRAISGMIKDFIFGSTHYHNEFDFPDWAKNKGHIFQSDDLLFYNNIY